MTAAAKNGTIYEFDEFQLIPEEDLLLRNGEPIPINPKAFRVLTLLVERNGHLVHKSEILDLIWQDSFVEEGSLSKAIWFVRHALGDTSKEKFIQTVPRRGYRFVFPVSVRADHSGAFRLPDLEGLNENGRGLTEKTNATTNGAAYGNGFRAARVPPTLRERSPYLVVGLIALVGVLVAFGAYLIFRPTSAVARTIAVLPFKSLAADARDESLEMGMAETLITRLGGIKYLTVRPITSVRKFAGLENDPVQAGKEMGVDSVLDGSIQKSGDRIRVTVRLVKTGDGETLWSENFEESATEIFKVQDRIAERVVEVLELHLSPSERQQTAKHYTDDPEAYDLYLHGQYLWHTRAPDSAEQRLDLYTRALRKDPNFALAHVAAGETYISLHGQGKISWQEAIPRAKEQLTKALRIDASLAEAYKLSGELKYQYEYEWAEAEKDFLKAIELDPNSGPSHLAYGFFLMTSGRFEEADVEIQKAQEIDPSSLTYRDVRAHLLYKSRRYDEAQRYLLQIIADFPQDTTAYDVLSGVYTQKQMYREAIDCTLKSMELRGRPADLITKLRRAFEKSGIEGFRQEKLRSITERSKTEYIRPNIFASSYAWLGDKENAFLWLRKSLDERDPVVSLKIDPEFDFLRDDPRYFEILRRLNLQP